MLGCVLAAEVVVSWVVLVWVVDRVLLVARVQG